MENDKPKNMILDKNEKKKSNKNGVPYLNVFSEHFNV